MLAVALLFGVGIAVAIVATGNSGNAVRIKRVVADDAQQAVQQLQDLIDQQHEVAGWPRAAATRGGRAPRPPAPPPRPRASVPAAIAARRSAISRAMNARLCSVTSRSAVSSRAANR